jgi:hypothetical protein
MTLNDWTQCDFCHFPALYSYFKTYVEKGNDCPMCSQKISASDLKLIPENKVKEILQGKLESIEKSEGMVDEEFSSGLKRGSARIPDELSLASMPQDLNDTHLSGYEKGDSILPPGLIGGPGGMVI